MRPTDFRAPARRLLPAAAAGLVLAATPAFAAPRAAAPAVQPEIAAPTGAAKLAAEAASMKALVKSDLAARFCDAASGLPAVEPRAIYQRKEDKAWLSEEAAARLPEAERAALRKVEIDEERYYTTRYGSSMAYARALELAASCGADPALTTLEGKRVLDYGYGAIGHLRLMASMGAHVTGVEVDETLPAIYSRPSDTGPVPGAAGAEDGSLRLVHGRWPADAAAKEGVAAGAAGGGKEGGYDLILSKNTLKNGYINPEHPVDKRMLVDLGVSHEEFVKSLHDALRPGGLLVIYNLSPKQNPDPAKYIPWADGRCPFPREMLEGAGFKVIAFDRDENAAAREMARVLGWDRQGMDIDEGLFGHATILQRPADR